ncbi:MAG TPA: hypothetical protein VFU99_04580 [Gaiellaceae bacterium]|nr:hypothetical protein [Gaiellaceae bacterium]
MRRRLLAVCGLVAVLGTGLALASCGSSDDGVAPPTDTTTTVTIVDTTTTVEPPAGPTEVSIVVVNGAPRGGIVREAVEKNDRVVLVVTSDVSDHVHLHGYDVIRDVGPGKPARLPFEATIPGRFEVELEVRGVQIADITVNP